jgi:hypothetical protein
VAGDRDQLRDLPHPSPLQQNPSLRSAAKIGEDAGDAVDEVVEAAEGGGRLDERTTERFCQMSVFFHPTLLFLIFLLADSV